MIELVVVRQHFVVVDFGFELVEHRELAIDERAVAAGHRDEDVRHAAAQHFDLLLGDVDEGVLHRVEGLGQLDSSSVPLAGMRSISGREPLPFGSRRALTSEGSCSVDTWLAPLATALMRLVIDREMIHASTRAMRVITKMMPIRRRVAELVASASALARSTIWLLMVVWKSTIPLTSPSKPSVSKVAVSPTWAARETWSSWLRYEVELGRESRLAELGGPVVGGDRLELTEQGVERAEVGAGLGESGHVGRGLLPAGDAVEDLVGGELRVGELDDGEEFATEGRVAGFGGEQLTDGDEFAAGFGVGLGRVDLGLEVGGQGRHVEVATGRRQGGAGLGDMVAGGVGGADHRDRVTQLVDVRVGGTGGHRCRRRWRDRPRTRSPRGCR